MKRVAALALLATLAPGISASAQNAALSFTTPSATVAPGDSISISVDVAYDTAGASGGLFGSPGFYGFGGQVVASGPSAGDLIVGTIAVDTRLASGVTTSTPGSAALVRAAAGRGFEGGLPTNPIAPVTFDLSIDAAATAGSVTLDYEGAVVLVLDSMLTTFSTAPGVNQSALSTAPLALTIVEATSCLCEFDADDAQVDVFDLLAFLDLWFPVDPAADIDGALGVDVFDLLFFLDCWFPASAGTPCP